MKQRKIRKNVYSDGGEIDADGGEIDADGGEIDTDGGVAPLAHQIPQNPYSSSSLYNCLCYQLLHERVLRVGQELRDP